MGIGAWTLLALAAAGLYFWYATIVKRRNRVTEALAGIDVQLQQRHASTTCGTCWTTTDVVLQRALIARVPMEGERFSPATPERFRCRRFYLPRRRR